MHYLKRMKTLLNIYLELSILILLLFQLIFRITLDVSAKIKAFSMVLI